MQISNYTKSMMKKRGYIQKLQLPPYAPYRVFYPKKKTRKSRDFLNMPLISPGMAEEEMLEIALHYPISMIERDIFFDAYPGWFLTAGVGYMPILPDTKEQLENKSKVKFLNGTNLKLPHSFIPTFIKTPSDKTTEYWKHGVFKRIQYGMTEEEMLNTALHRPLLFDEATIFFEAYPEWFI